MPDDGRPAQTLSTPSQETAAARPHRRAIVWLRYSIVLAVAAVALFAAGDWAYWQWAHVSETDARIKADTVTVASRASGWIIDLPVAEGDRVDRDRLLLTVDARDLRLQVGEIEARIAALEAERDQLAARLDMIDRVGAARVEAAGARAEAARVAVDASREQLALARADDERARSLVAGAVVSRQRLDQVRNALSLARERHQSAKAEHAAARADVVEAEAERAETIVLERSMEVLRHQAAELSARRDRLNLDIADRAIRAPLSGVVSEIFVDRGEFVSPGQRLLLVHDPVDIWVEANIKETDIRHLSPGMHAEISVDAYPDRVFQGRVERIGEAATSEFALLPNPNPSGNFTKVTQRLPVRIAIDQDRGLLRPGMMAVVNIEIPGR